MLVVSSSQDVQEQIKIKDVKKTVRTYKTKSLEVETERYLGYLTMQREIILTNV